MKKVLTILLLLSFITVSTTACSNKKKKPKPNMIQAERRFAKYMDQSQVKDPNRVDLSEGPN